MYRTSVILRHTFVEALAQPVFLLMLLLGVTVLGIYGFLPFFTLGEDTRMYKSVCMDIILILTLVTTLLATSKSSFEEIEDRTMLTLLSKPVGRWEVLVGKYLGLILSAGVMVAVMGLFLILCLWKRTPGDYQLSTQSLYPDVIRQISDYRFMHLAGVYPSLLLIWLQVAVLAAISVAISTRFAFVVNLPVVILIYLVGNMARFIDAATDKSTDQLRGLGWLIQTCFPFLHTFDLRDMTVYRDVKLRGTMFEFASQGVTVSEIWLGTGTAAVYAVFYITAALCLGMILFRNRELGGAEG